MPGADRNPPRRQPGAGRTLAVGLMSGTSADGIDGVLLSISSPRRSSSHRVVIETAAHLPFPNSLQKQINAVIREPTVGLDQLGRLHARLGDLYAQAANRLMPESGAAVAVIGCHGQTIRHRPDGKFPFTLQLGGGALIAGRTGIPTVSDFRGADLAAGGQGAPLAPAFHQAVFASDTETRAVLNLGGIANLTHLPAGADQVITGFDTGPANTLLDDWCRRHFNQPCDRDGAIAAGGAVHGKLLAEMLADPYFARPPPKSTGREYFNRVWLDQILAARAFAALPPADVLATLTALTAETVARGLNGLKPAVEAVYACGGGTRNRTLMAMLGERGRGAMATTSQLGIDPQWVEACAFAWLAHQTLRRIPATLPSVTGATRPTIAGAIYFPD